MLSSCDWVPVESCSRSLHHLEHAEGDARHQRDTAADRERLHREQAAPRCLSENIEEFFLLTASTAAWHR